MSITPLPTPTPSRNQTQSAFIEAANVFLGALPTFVTEANAQAGENNSNANKSQNYATKDDGYADGTDNSARSWAVGGTGNGQPSQGSAKDWAIKHGSTVDGSEYSSKEHAVGTDVTPDGSAKEWAVRTDAPVRSGLHSAKMYAHGIVPDGSAKDWANKMSTPVDGDYSAKEYAIGDDVPLGSAKDWAIKDGLVDGDYSAKHFAQESHQARNGALAAANYQGVWSTLVGPISIPSSVYHNGSFWVLLENIANVAAEEPGVSDKWEPLVKPILYIDYDDRAQLRIPGPRDGDLALVEGLGLFLFVEGSDEPDDDESCFESLGGKWLLEAPHWDVVNDWQLPDDSERDDRAEVFEGRFLHGKAECTIITVNSTATVAFTGTVQGAEVGDVVIATPPSKLEAATGRLSYYAYVSAKDTVSIQLCNASAAVINTNTAIRTNWPVMVIKEG